MSYLGKYYLARGRILYVDELRIIREYRSKIFISKDGGIKWSLMRNEIKNGLFKNFFRGHYYARLFRLGIHHLIPFENNYYVVFIDKNISIINGNTKIAELQISGSRPLCVLGHNNSVYYGEYYSNKNRNPIKIWQFEIDKPENYRIVAQISDVRHIHGVFYDMYTNSIWFTSGDDNTESILWVTYDNFKNIEKVINKGQQTRAVQLIFTADFVYFGSDTPNEQNFIYRLDRQSGQVSKMQQTSGSVFYGCKVGDALFFSTAVEPSKINVHNYSELWASRDGVSWKKVLQFKKDILDKRFFQYGQILFPYGVGDEKNLWFTPFSTSRSYKIFKIPLADIFDNGTLR